MFKANHLQIYTIDVKYDPQDKIWSGSSKDIPGLFLEAESYEEFVAEANDIAPHLIKNNLRIPEGENLNGLKFHGVDLNLH